MPWLEINEITKLLRCKVCNIGFSENHFGKLQKHTNTNGHQKKLKSRNIDLNIEIKAPQMNSVNVTEALIINEEQAPNFNQNDLLIVNKRTCVQEHVENFSENSLGNQIQISTEGFVPIEKALTNLNALTQDDSENNLGDRTETIISSDQIAKSLKKSENPSNLSIIHRDFSTTPQINAQDLQKNVGKQHFSIEDSFF